MNKYVMCVDKQEMMFPPQMCVTHNKTLCGACLSQMETGIRG